MKALILSLVFAAAAMAQTKPSVMQLSAAGLSTGAPGSSYSALLFTGGTVRIVLLDATQFTVDSANVLHLILPSPAPSGGNRVVGECSVLTLSTSVFTLAKTTAAPLTLAVFYNGVRWNTAAGDYTVAGNVITFVNQIGQVGATVCFDYSY